MFVQVLCKGQNEQSHLKMSSPIKTRLDTCDVMAQGTIEVPINGSCSTSRLSLCLMPSVGRSTSGKGAEGGWRGAPGRLWRSNNLGQGEHKLGRPRLSSSKGELGTEVDAAGTSCCGGRSEVSVPVRSWVGHLPLAAQSLSFLIAIVTVVIWAPDEPRPCRNDSVFAEAFSFTNRDLILVGSDCGEETRQGPGCVRPSDEGRQLSARNQVAVQGCPSTHRWLWKEPTHL